MLPVLANGLREGAKFDVLTLPFGDAGAAAAAQRADALVVFYGSPTQSLQSVVQELAPLEVVPSTESLPRLKARLQAIAVK